MIKRWEHRWFCLVCNTDVLRHHRSRHEASDYHKRLVNKPQHMEEQLNPLTPEQAFTQFLFSFNVRKLKGYERKLYNIYKEMK